MHMYLWFVVGCQPLVPPELASRLEDLNVLDARCIENDYAEIDEYLTLAFGGWGFQGGRAVWCDLPGGQYTEAGRKIFAPLDAAEQINWQFCQGPPDYPCVGVTTDDVQPEIVPVKWTCKNSSPGRRVVIGASVDWTCENLDQYAELVDQDATDSAYISAEFLLVF